MPYKTIPGTDTTYALISFDKHGRESTGDPDAGGGAFSDRIRTQVREERPTHLFFFSHGWKGDLEAAVDQYNRWIKAMLDLGEDRSAMGNNFKPMWIGLHWPSLPWGDEELAGASFGLDEDSTFGAPPAPETLIELYLERLGVGEDERPLVATIINAHQRDAAARELPDDAATAYQELASRLGHHAEGLDGPPDADGTPFDARKSFEAGNAASAGSDFGGSWFLGGILGPLRQLSYWTMKKRARAIGETGLHLFVQDLMKAAPDTRFHLMGHSFGCIVVSSILGGPGGRDPLPRPVDSVALVQGAVSLWAFADEIPSTSGTGYFNPLIRRSVVRGPIITTRSVHDRAVGLFYPLASAAALADPSFDLDDPASLPKFGAIGAYGMRGLTGSVQRDMLPENQAYGFEPGKIYNLQASRYIRKGGGASGAHSDIDGPQVAHALWQAAGI